MPVQIVMDVTGDTRHQFDISDESIRQAEQRFNELCRSGYTAAARQKGGRSVLLRKFDPAVEETVFFPRLKGG